MRWPPLYIVLAALFVFLYLMGDVPMINNLIDKGIELLRAVPALFDR